MPGVGGILFLFWPLPSYLHCFMLATAPRELLTYSVEYVLKFLRSLYVARYVASIGR